MIVVRALAPMIWTCWLITKSLLMLMTPAGTTIVSVPASRAASVRAARSVVHVVPVHDPPGSSEVVTVSVAADAGAAHSSAVISAMNAARQPTDRP